MRPTFATSVAAVAVVLVAARVASADDRLAFETIFSSDGGPARADRRVIQSRADLDAFFGGQAPTLAVDFERETVIAVALGRQTRAGATIEVQAITQKTLGGTHVACVDVVARRATAGEADAFLSSAPVQLVKLRKSATRFVFRDAAASAPAFDTLRMTLRPSSGFFWTYVLELDRQGRVTVSREHDRPEREQSTATGTATAAELRAIQAAFTKADLATIPSPFTPADLRVESGTALVLAATSASGTITRAGQVGFWGESGARLRPLADALEALAKRIAEEGSAVVRDVTGTVTVSGGAVVILENRSSALEVTNEPFRSLLRALPADAIVVASARVTRTHAFGGTAELVNLQAQLPSGATVREAPKETARANGGLAENALVRIIGRDGDWLCVMHDGRAGWIKKSSARVAILPPAADTKGVVNGLPR